MDQKLTLHNRWGYQNISLKKKSKIKIKDKNSDKLLDLAQPSTDSIKIQAIYNNKSEV